MVEPEVKPGAPGAAQPPVEEPLPWLEELPPRQIVAELDRYIVGQAAAKKSVAIAIRNRWRRAQAPDEIREEILPNNIIMIGPTGRREDGDRAPPRPARGRAVPQGRGVEVHRGGLRRPRRRVHGARPRGLRDPDGAGRARRRHLPAGRGARRGAAAGPAPAAGRQGRARRPPSRGRSRPSPPRARSARCSSSRPRGTSPSGPTRRTPSCRSAASAPATSSARSSRTGSSRSATSRSR